MRSSINTFKKAQEENILVSGPIKKFFNNVRSRMHPSCIGLLEGPDSTTTINDTERADLFDDIFQSVFIPNDSNAPPSLLAPIKLCLLLYFWYPTSGNPSVLPVILYHVALIVFPFYF